MKTGFNGDALDFLPIERAIEKRQSISPRIKKNAIEISDSDSDSIGYNKVRQGSPTRKTTTIFKIDSDEKKMVSFDGDKIADQAGKTGRSSQFRRQNTS